MTTSKYVMNTLNHIYLYTFFSKIIGFKGKRKVPEFTQLDFSGRSDHPYRAPIGSLQKHVP